uniref:Uncharacterized protein n=1 Tax=Nelumbo nucifera TaxID=4432 RepID=A0A822XUC1_NELNU|nr:TPA_asm: hypothetical protein HUJ06_023878 [Nelumbo nucifera]
MFLFKFKIYGKRHFDNYGTNKSIRKKKANQANRVPSFP